ncbi:MAG: polysaccharide biosynthesis tyrosine autokinase [Planctomycetes bacterium]|nr:polysaccharide biosynthesis tyrosine autokinase [Planctomycetota bacterium]
MGPEDRDTAPLSHPRIYRERIATADRPFIYEVIRILRGRLTVFLTAALLVSVVVVYQLMSAEPVYFASSEILIERQESRLGNLNAPVVVDTYDPDYYQTQFRILQGAGLMDSVVQRLKLEGRYGSDELRGKLQVNWVRNSRVAEVGVRLNDPKVAADIVNALVDEYKRATLDRKLVGIKDLHVRMLDRLGDLRKALDESERRLNEYCTQHAIFPTEDPVYQRMIEITGVALVNERRELGRLETVCADIEKAQRDVAKLEPILAAENIRPLDDLRLEHARSQRDLEEMRAIYGTGYPGLPGAEARAKELRRKVEDEIGKQADALVQRRDALRETAKMAREAFEEVRKERLDQQAMQAQVDVLRRERDALRALYDALILRIKESEISSGLDATNVYVLSPAEPPSQAIWPSLLYSLLIAVVLALVGGGAATLLVEYLDNTVRTAEDIELTYGLPVLTVVPQRKPDQTNVPTPIASWQDDRSQVAEAFRRLRAAVLLSVRDIEGGSVRRIMVAAAGASEGKTITATNLAITLAQLGNRTLLIDTDFYMSETAKYFGLEEDRGLTSILTQDLTLEQTVQSTPVPCLDFLATGMIPPQPASLLSSARMKWLLDEASRLYNRVIIDTPPLMAVTDGTLLAPHMDAIILVVSQGKTQKIALRRVIQTLGRIGVKPLGFVLNNVRTGVGEFYLKYPRPADSLAATMQPKPVSGEPHA